MKKEMVKVARCLRCGYQHYNVGSYMWRHMKTVHGEGLLKGKNWVFTGKLEEASYFKKNKTPVARNKTVKQKPVKRNVITPEMKHIDIPVILRIPLTLGQVQILSTEEK